MQSVKIKKSNFSILSGSFEPLLNSIITKDRRAQGETYQIKGFSKLSTANKIFEIVRNVWGFSIRFEKDKKNIVGIEYGWLNGIGDELLFMKIIAPYVEKNSYITMFSENGDMWRYFFNGYECKLQVPEIRWLNEPLDKKMNAKN